LGSNSAYLYVGFPSERGGEDWSRFDYDFFQLERAAAAGLSAGSLGRRRAFTARALAVLGRKPGPRAGAAEGGDAAETRSLRSEGGAMGKECRDRRRQCPEPHPGTTQNRGPRWAGDRRSGEAPGL
jgi:hypothetical protein